MQGSAAQRKVSGSGVCPLSVMEALGLYFREASTLTLYVIYV